MKMRLESEIHRDQKQPRSKTFAEHVIDKFYLK